MRGDARFMAIGGTGVITTGGTATAAGAITNISLLDANGNTIALDDVAVEIGDSSEDVLNNWVASWNAQIAKTGVFATIVDAATSEVRWDSVIDWSTSSGGVPPTVQVTYGTSNATGIASGVGVTGGTGNTSISRLEDLDISSVAGAGQAMTIIDKALTTVNGARADLGAVQNRFQSVVANLETAELTRTQILQQAGTSMLAQANQIPANVLALLR